MDIDAKALVDAAREVSSNAYVPYSDFRTGAAVLTEDGQTHVGALVENLVFGVAMCAERVALFSSVAAGGSRPVAMAVVSPTTAGELTFPCGPCLQVAIELGGSEMMIVAAAHDDGTVERKTVQQLAPGIPRRKGSPD
ncbi:MAG: cytidine deaminase [Acidimicrobiia bacterium]|nr:cytidine deaminase [Acidimicrobiia bacterium]